MKQNPLPLADRLLADPDYAIRVFRELKLGARKTRTSGKAELTNIRRWFEALIRPKLDFFRPGTTQGRITPHRGHRCRLWDDGAMLSPICSERSAFATDTGYGLRLMPRYSQQGYMACGNCPVRQSPQGSATALDAARTVFYLPDTQGSLQPLAPKGGCSPDLSQS